MLAALPFIGLPVLIHLINQRRHKTRRWAAMQFLVQAKRMTHGMARLRHLLIMLLRMAVVAGIILAISRPMATGMLGMTGGVADTTLILLDRSASMEQQDLATGESKRSAATHRIAELLKTLGNSQHVVLIDSISNKPIEIQSIDQLPNLPEVAPTSTTSNIPAMLQVANDYIMTNKTGRTDIWICSDGRSNDWNPDSSAWDILRDGFSETDGVRFHLLSYDELPRENVSVRVENVQLRKVGSSQELVLDIYLKRNSRREGALQVPLEFVINGNRSVMPIEMREDEFVLQGHTLPMDSATSEGWGRVSLPQDDNPSDNQCYFVFADSPLQKSVIVSDDSAVSEFLRLALTAPADPQLKYFAEILPISQAVGIDWEETALIVWHAPIPDKESLVGKQLQKFVSNGRTVLFLPPEQIGGNHLFGIGWEKWNDTASGDPLKLASWRQQSDLLGQTRSGHPLPLDDLQISRYCSLSGMGSGMEKNNDAGGGTVLARLAGGEPMLVRKEGARGGFGGGAYFCSTVPNARYSNLARNGVVVYVMLHRALAQGSQNLGHAKSLPAGEADPQAASHWKVLSASSKHATASVRSLYSGAYQSGDETLVALNRPFSEDALEVLDDAKVAELFSSLDYRKIVGQLGETSNLANEIWKTFLVVMGLALLGEALLCIPPSKKREELAI